MTPRLLGIDAGSTVTKSVVFTLDGQVTATASRRVEVSTPRPHHVERDQDGLWDAVVATVRAVLSTTDPDEIVGVGVTAHGDGVYLLDVNGRPTRPGIMSLDTRARAVVDRWDASGVSDAALELTGQRPWPSAPASLIAWLWANEPDVMRETRWALPAKDTLKHRLTGEFSTEPTEASLSFTNVATQRYDDAVLDLFGLQASAGQLAPALPCASVSGVISRAAADATGLRVGTPVAASAHDVDCSAIGTGVIAPGMLSVIAGTFSINQAVSQAPYTSPHWCARNFVLDGHWMNMSISPTSAANMEWFAQQLCAGDVAAGAVRGDAFAFVREELEAVADDPSDIVYLPFLYGSPLSQDASATIVGLRGWHSRGHLLRAVMQGVAMTHRWHVDRLTTRFPSALVRLTGGASRSPDWRQMFADVLRLPVEVTTAIETGALGAGMLAGIAAGAYGDLGEAASQCVSVAERYDPRPEAAGELDHLYARFVAIVAALAPVWEHGDAR